MSPRLPDSRRGQAGLVAAETGRIRCPSWSSRTEMPCSGVTVRPSESVDVERREEGRLLGIAHLVLVEGAVCRPEGRDSGRSCWGRAEIRRQPALPGARRPGCPPCRPGRSRCHGGVFLVQSRSLDRRACCPPSTRHRSHATRIIGVLKRNSCCWCSLRSDCVPRRRSVSSILSGHVRTRANALISNRHSRPRE